MDLVIYLLYNLSFVLIDFRMRNVIQGLRGDFRLEILIVFNGQWMSRSDVVLLMN